VPVSLPAWPLSAETRHNLYLAFKEALNNAVKHAHATEVRISLALESNAFVLTVEDNGKGFYEDAIQEGTGIGNLRNRLSEIGGKVKIESKPGRGARVTFMVPARKRSPS